MAARSATSEESLRDTFHRAVVAFLAWRSTNDRKAVLSYVAYHRLALLPLSYPTIRQGGRCGYSGEPRIRYGGKEYTLTTICRYAKGIPEPLPPLLRELVEGVLTGIVEVETYAEAAECLREAIELEYPCGSALSSSSLITRQPLSTTVARAESALVTS